MINYIKDNFEVVMINDKIMDCFILFKINDELYHLTISDVYVLTTKDYVTIYENKGALIEWLNIVKK